MKRLPILTGGPALLVLCLAVRSADPSVSTNVETVSRAPVIEPDYSGIVIPPNIAPLNFSVREPGVRYRVEIRSAEGSPITLQGKKPDFQIPQGPWKRLLSANQGREILFDIEVQSESGRWTRYAAIRNRIARERIDSRLVYRLIEPQFRYWKHMGIYQRNLENFEESCILRNELTGEN